MAARYLVPPSTSGTLIIYHHGVGEDKTAWTSDPLKSELRTALLDEGYILAASNAHGENWGNANSIADYNALYADAIGRYIVTKVIFISQSMGGMSGLNCIQNGTIPVAGWVGIYPACNLAWCYANGFTAAINTAYGISGDYAAKTAGYDPVLLDGTHFTTRMRFYASASDTTVSKTNNSDAMATVVNGHAAENTVVVCSGNHGDPSHFQPSDVIAFIKRC